MPYRVILAVVTIGLLLAGCTRPNSGASAATMNNTLTTAEQAQGWRLLFDGRSTAGWRGYRGGGVPSGWEVIDSSLVRVATGAGDIVTIERFRNFDLTLEWKVGPGGNSGIFYRGVETGQEIWRTALEMQVLDDERHPDGRSELTSAGALYALYPTKRGVVRPAGEWNQARVLLNGNRGEHWLNGVKLFDFEIGSNDWNQRLQASKFAGETRFAAAADGHIGLQDHEPAPGFGGAEDRIEFRNIKIRALP